MCLQLLAVQCTELQSEGKKTWHHVLSIAQPEPKRNAAPLWGRIKEELLSGFRYGWAIIGMGGGQACGLSPTIPPNGLNQGKPHKIHDKAEW